jgi:hypothetical protein
LACLNNMVDNSRLAAVDTYTKIGVKSLFFNYFTKAILVFIAFTVNVLLTGFCLKKYNKKLN